MNVWVMSLGYGIAALCCIGLLFVVVRLLRHVVPTGIVPVLVGATVVAFSAWLAWYMLPTSLTYRGYLAVCVAGGVMAIMFARSSLSWKKLGVAAGLVIVGIAGLLAYGESTLPASVAARLSDKEATLKEIEVLPLSHVLPFLWIPIMGFISHLVIPDEKGLGYKNWTITWQVVGWTAAAVLLQQYADLWVAVFRALGVHMHTWLYVLPDTGWFAFLMAFTGILLAFLLLVHTFYSTKILPLVVSVTFAILFWILFQT